MPCSKDLFTIKINCRNVRWKKDCSSHSNCVASFVQISNRSHGRFENRFVVKVWTCVKQCIREGIRCDFFSAYIKVKLAPKRLNIIQRQACEHACRKASRAPSPLSTYHCTHVDTMWERVWGWHGALLNGSFHNQLRLVPLGNGVTHIPSISTLLPPAKRQSGPRNTKPANSIECTMHGRFTS